MHAASGRTTWHDSAHGRGSSHCFHLRSLGFLVAPVHGHVADAWRDSRSRHDSRKLLSCIRLAADIAGGPSGLLKVVAQSLAVALPPFLQQAFVDSSLQPSAAFRDTLPSAALVQRYELSFDISLMMLEHSGVPLESYFRVGWTDSSPLAGYDWIWSQSHVVKKADAWEVFKATKAIHKHVANFVETCVELHGGFDAEVAGFLGSGELLSQCQPATRVLAASVRELISPPAALGSGHRGLADKASAEVYKWALHSFPGQPLADHAMSYIAHCGDMGVEMGLPDFELIGPVETLLPKWMERQPLHPDLDLEMRQGCFSDVDGPLASVGAHHFGTTACLPHPLV